MSPKQSEKLSLYQLIRCASVYERGTCHFMAEKNHPEPK